MTKHIIPYGKQWVDATDIASVVHVLNTDWITQGPTIAAFEKAIATRSGVKYGVACSNGTAALHLACLSAGIGPGDEVIVPSLTFVASANCVIYCGAKPILCDIDLATLTVDSKDVESKINKHTKAIIAVDFGGHPARWNELRAIAKKHHLILIDDAAHSLGATYRKKPIGTVADLTTFSFHPVKAITTAEGGMIVTNNAKYAEKALLLRTHGIRKFPDRPGWYQEMVDLGYNFRITDIQAALGLSQFKKLNSFLRRRYQIAMQYMNAFKNVPEIILPPNQKWVGHAWHIFPIQLRTKNRDVIYESLKKRGIGSQIHYMPIHLQPYYQKKFGYKKGDFPQAETYFSRCLTIPLFPKMSDAMVKKVIRAVLLETS